LRGACVDQYRQAERQIDLPRKGYDLLRLAVFEYFYVLSLEAGEQAAVLVLCGK